MKIVNNIQDAIPVLIGAVIHGDLVTVNALLDRFPALIELRDKRGRNLLMMSAYLSDSGMINYFVSYFVLINRKLNPNAVDEDGLNAMDWAILGGNEFALSLLTKVAQGENWSNEDEANDPDYGS